MNAWDVTARCAAALSYASQLPESTCDTHRKEPQVDADGVVLD
jgi:hypothetical protein